MKRRVVMGLLLVTALTFAAACGKTDENGTKQETAETKQEVVDYEEVTEKELEVLAYDKDVDAMMELARRYDYGTDTCPQNFDDAKKWYEMAEAQGNAKASCVLGYYALHGMGGEIDLDQAAEYFQKSIEEGEDDALTGMGRTYLAGYGKEEERTEWAYAYIEQAYEKNNPSGVYAMAYLLENGIGTAQDYVKAMELYARLTEWEDLSFYDAYLSDSAWTSIGLMYVHGEGTDVDYDMALQAFERAADNEYAMAEYYLGQMYENGYGTDQDYEDAYKWYQKAAEQDFAPAQNQIGYLYYNGYGVDTDIDQAVYYQKLAAMQGYAAAQINLGYLFENGIGVEQDYNTALSYYQMAAEQEQDGAKEAVVRVLKQMNEEQ